MAGDGDDEGDDDIILVTNLVMTLIILRMVMTVMIL